MKSLTQTLLAGAAVVAFAVAAHAAPAVGQPAPDFTLTDISGQPHSLSAYKGRTVVLEWVNPECPIVRKHYEKSGNIPATQKAALADGAVWLAINSGHPGAQGDFDAAQVAEWSKKNNTAFTAYLRDQNGKVGKLYDARQTPTLFIINPAGTLVYAGGIDDISSGNAADIARANNYVKAALAELKSGKPVSKPVTKAYGCNVKYAN
ncbi:MAG: hypothetical protein QG602_370 [Verrucomicrobiota bacterium]|nr:hypothetical protein [Verrucomicrobiota bacterium]